MFLLSCNGNLICQSLKYQNDPCDFVSFIGCCSKHKFFVENRSKHGLSTINMYSSQKYHIRLLPPNTGHLSTKATQRPLSSVPKMAVMERLDCIYQFYSCANLNYNFSKHQQFKASCWGCNDFYIGKTKRRLHDRKTEHFKALPDMARTARLQRGGGGLTSNALACVNQRGQEACSPRKFVKLIYFQQQKSGVLKQEFKPEQSRLPQLGIRLQLFINLFLYQFLISGFTTKPSRRDARYFENGPLGPLMGTRQ